MVGSDESIGAGGCCGKATDAEAELDSVEVAGFDREFDPLQPRSHAMIKTEEKIVFKSGFIHTTFTHAL